MTEKLSKQQRERLRRLVSKTIVLRYTTAESLDYIRHELGVPISERYFFDVKANIKEENLYVMEHYNENMHASILSEFMGRIEGIKVLQEEQWSLYHSADNTRLKSDILVRLADLSKILSQLYELLPDWLNYSTNENELKRINRNKNRKVEPLTGEDLGAIAMNSNEAKF